MISGRVATIPSRTARKCLCCANFSIGPDNFCSKNIVNLSIMNLIPFHLHIKPNIQPEITDNSDCYKKTKIHCNKVFMKPLISFYKIPAITDCKTYNNSISYQCCDSCVYPKTCNHIGEEKARECST